jgi:hypothetical protein
MSEALEISREIPLTNPPRGALVLLDGERSHVLALRLEHTRVLTIEMDGAARDALTDACLRWQSPQDELPDEEVTLLLGLDSPDTDEVVLGYRDGGLWIRDSGQVIRQDVYAWAYAPVAPKKRGAS